MTLGPFRSVAFASLLALLIPAVGRAEDPEPAPDEIFVDRVAVDVVDVEVFVTDRDGRPVTDLGRDDFEVREDGKPVEIVNFYAVRDRRPLPTSDAASPETASGPELDPLDALQRSRDAVYGELPPERQRLHLVVFVDNLNVHPLNRNRVFQQIRAFLRETVGPGDEVLVASYDRSLAIEQPFTSSPEDVATALLELERASGGGAQREAQRMEAIKAIYEASDVRRALQEAKNFSDEGHHEIQGTLDALGEMVDSLAGLPGRKVVLHVSDGLPMVPGRDLYQAIQQRFADLSVLAEASSRDASRRYVELIQRANSRRVSFYTIDAGGLRTQLGTGAENAAINSPLMLSTAVHAVRTKNLQGTLIMMANRTGGRAILNSNDIGDELREVARDLGNYYSIGYRPPADDRGRYHEIEVRLKDRSRRLDVRHREGYRDRSFEKRMEDALQAWLVHGYEANPLGISIELGPQAPADDGLVEVPIGVRVPVAELLLVPRPGARHGQLMIYFSALDEEGRSAPVQQLPFEVRIPEESLAAALEDDVVRVLRLTMRPGYQRVVVGVRDEISEERSVVGRGIAVGRPARLPGG